MKKIKFFCQKYLENRPMFFCFIRPYEAQLMYDRRNLMNGKILDFGCGDGFFASLVFGRKKIDVGLDIYESRAKHSEVAEVYKSLKLFDGKKIPFKNDCFDSVFSSSVLEHIPNLNENVRELNRVLKTGGIAMITVMTDKWDENLRTMGNAKAGEVYRKWMKKKQEHYNLLTYKEWSSLFKKHGFEIVEKRSYLGSFYVVLMDIAHYLSIFSLLTHIVFGKWVVWKDWYKILGLDNFFTKINKNLLANSNDGAALFFVLKKIN